MNDESHDRVSNRLRTALYRESLALVEAGVATPGSIDSVVKNAIGRRLSVGGPFEVWEQIGWDLVQVIAGELFKEISVATVPPEPVDELEGPPISADSGSTQFERIAVLGAGLLGHGIALEFAAHGKQVKLLDVSEELLEEAVARARIGLLALASSGQISGADVESSLGRISVITDLSEAVKDADLVVEAVSENLELKKKIFSAVGKAAPAHAILASNSSTFVPSAYGSGTGRPHQVIGIHYFNPPHLLPGVEIVIGPETSEDVVEKIVGLYESLGKTTAVVKREIQGFIGNRLQVALLREAMSIVESGIATAPEVDEIVRTGFGKKLPDTGIFGMATIDKIAVELFPQLNNSRELPRLLLDKIDSGDLGVKSGRGFYTWTPESAEAWRANMAESLLALGQR
ncbi:MAG: NAD(P)-binding domain-containing protein [Chloroflexi bacterium]|nr:NAD(P)-binding domain-containing protein [Chloroflexota bacterium]